MCVRTHACVVSLCFQLGDLLLSLQQLLSTHIHFLRKSSKLLQCVKHKKTGFCLKWHTVIHQLKQHSVEPDTVMSVILWEDLVIEGAEALFN